MDRLVILSDSGNRVQVKTAIGNIGYISKDNISSIWIKVWKKEHKLMLMRETEIIKTYPIALGFNPIDDKVRQGDGCTPEGRFYLCEMLEKPQPPERYGARSMRLSYPCSEDARRGLRDKLITRKQYSAEEKIRIVLEGLRGEDSIAKLCRREGIAQSQCPTSALTKRN